MYRILLIALCLLLCSCHSGQKDSSILKVTRIGVDDDSYANVRQIVFEFNHDIAIPGAVPSQAQIDTVTIKSKQLAAQCHWRFVDNRRMACELQQSLYPGSYYQVEIAKGLPGLNQSTVNSLSKTVKTTYPVYQVDAKYDVQDFFEKVTLTHSNEQVFDIQSLQKSLKIKTPSKQNASLGLAADSKDKNKYRLMAPLFDDIEQGRYQVVLAAGFKLPKSDYALEEELLLHEFSFYYSFKWLGFVCAQGNRFVPVALNPDKSIDCAPKALGLRFSQRVDRERNIGRKFGWLTGPRYWDVWHPPGDDDGFVYPIQLQGEANYRLDLTAVRSIDGERLESSSVIEFTTGVAAPHWRLFSPKPRVVEADLQTTPQLRSTNINSLNARVTLIKTPADLLAHINDETLPVIDMAWPLNDIGSSRPVNTPLPWRDQLGHQSGLAWVEVQDNNKKQSQLVNSAAFNMVYWVTDDLLVYLASWQQSEGIDKADISLLCEGDSTIHLLGQTGDDGLFLLPKERWQSVYQARKTCWLWAKQGQLSAAIEITPSINNRQNINIHSWTAQPLYSPGETIDLGFIARQRGGKGMTPVTDLSDYILTMTRSRHGESPIEIGPVTLSAPSRFGFASAQIKTDKQLAPGRYDFYLRKTDEHGNEVFNLFVSGVAIGEYIVPEYEVIIDTPTQVFANTALTADITARRLNGLPLPRAKVELEYSFQDRYVKPEWWPKKYSFVSYEDRRNIKPLAITHNNTLDENGRYHYSSEVLSTDYPAARLNLKTVITASDGEVQQHDNRMMYLGRHHYIGTRQTDGGDQIKIIAINADGSPHNDTAVEVEFYHKRGSKKQLLGHCSLKSLPGLCQLPQYYDDRIQLVITSGTERYKWRRYFYYHHGKTSQIHNKQFQLTTGVKSVPAGKPASLSLYSPHAGKVLLVAEAGGIVRRWFKNVVQGDNTLSFDIKAQWFPGVKVTAYMLLERIKDIDTFMAQHKNPFRGLYSELMLNIELTEAELNVQTTVDKTQLQSGGSVEVTLQSNQDADSQVWLVNEALWQLTFTDIRDFDLDRQFVNSGGSVSWSWFYGLFSTLTYFQIYAPPVAEPNPDGRVYFSDDGGQDLSFVSAGGVRSFANASAHAKPTANGNFKQALWLDVVNLKAGQPQTRTVTLPQLLGRWKLVTVSANDQQFAVNSLSIQTGQDFEYFLDAPTTMLAGDKAQLSITVINRLHSAAQDTVKLWIDDKFVKTIDIKTKPRAQQLFSIDLPPLTSGEHQIRLSSQQQSGFLTQRIVNVKSNLAPQQQVWLYQNDQVPQLVLPPVFEPHSIKLYYNPVDEVAPHWYALNEYNRDFPHQCWEQTLSRSLSYAYGANAEQYWPQGRAQLGKGLKQSHRFIRGNKLFSFFEDGKGDPFLTAYSYLAQFWLAQKQLSSPVDKTAQKAVVLAMAQDKKQSVLTRSMALLALTANGDIEVGQALQMRQNIGQGPVYAQALQLLALTLVDAPAALVNQATNQLLAQGYQDPSVSLLNHNSQRCFTALALGQAHPRAQQLIGEVIKSQWQQGHFGSTFANGVCSYLLSDKTTPMNKPYDLDTRTAHGKAFFSKPKGQYWLNLNYQLAYADMTAQQNGLKVSRQYYIKDTNWQPVQANHTFAVGDVVKVELTVENPTERAHLALVDHVPGAFEAINPAHKTSFSDISTEGQNFTIKAGKVSFYPRHLPKGKSVFSYGAIVRYKGDYLVPPVRAELMYQIAVWAQSDINRLQVR